jgi:hypothetical protein
MPSTTSLSYRDEDVELTDERSFAAARAFLSELFDA